MMKLEDLDLSKTYTYADYLSWHFHERLELIRGKIFKMAPAPNTHHQEISGNLFFRIRYSLGDQRCKVFTAPFDVRIPLPPGQIKDDQIDTVVQPDISVICDLEKLDDRGCLGPPEWVIEIASPGTSKKDAKEKFELYQFSGVQEYWLVYPVEQQVLVYYRNEDGKYVGLPPFVKEDRIYSVLFPDLGIDLEAVFPEMDLAEEDWGDYVRL